MATRPCPASTRALIIFLMPLSFFAFSTVAALTVIPKTDHPVATPIRHDSLLLASHTASRSGSSLVQLGLHPLKTEVAVIKHRVVIIGFDQLLYLAAAKVNVTMNVIEKKRVPTWLPIMVPTRAATRIVIVFFDGG